MTYSFIVPVYNCKEYLSSCVQSICAVDAGEYEIILVDDGSLDGSSMVCDELAAKCPKIKVVHQVNAGVSAARNRGLREAKGEYVLFFDADDSIDSVALRVILEDERCKKSDLTIFGMSFDYYYHGNCYRRDALFHKHDGVLSRQQWGRSFATLFMDNSLSPVWNKVYKREKLTQLFLNTGMFLYEDLEFSLRYLSRCDSIFNVPKAVYHYRQPEDEGNAKRRLARIDSISSFMQPLHDAMSEVVARNGAVTGVDADEVLLQLYLVLAKEKISTANLSGVGGICEDFASWAKKHDCRAPYEDEIFYRHLLLGKAFALKLKDKKTAIRHTIAVWLKGHGLYK